MKTSFSQLGVHSPCYKDPAMKARKGARVYENEQYMGEIEEVKHEGKGIIIRLTNNLMWIYKFSDGSFNSSLYLA